MVDPAFTPLKHARVVDVIVMECALRASVRLCRCRGDALMIQGIVPSDGSKFFYLGERMVLVVDPSAHTFTRYVYALPVFFLLFRSLLPAGLFPLPSPNLSTLRFVAARLRPIAPTASARTARKWRRCPSTACTAR